MQAIGIIHTAFKQKFGIPRQSGLVPKAIGEIELFTPFSSPDAFRDIENYDHLWIIFKFHLNQENEWQPLVRPPRLGGNKKVGVFASRSPYRPNGLGLSLVKLIEKQIVDGKVRLIVEAIDLHDQTPILDIKPYLPDLESIPHAKDSWRKETTHQVNLPVLFSPQAESHLLRFDDAHRELIVAVLQQDPRPGHRRKCTEDDPQHYGMKIFNYDVRWLVKKDAIWVEQIVEDQLDEKDESE